MAADNTAALGRIAELVEVLRRLSDLPKTAAPAVAKATKEALEDQIAAGQFPSGAAWRATQEGKQALVGAAQALDVSAIGNVIVARLSGPEARHSVGAVRGKVQRQILPTGAGQLRAIGSAVERVLVEAVKGAL